MVIVLTARVSVRVLEGGVMGMVLQIPLGRVIMPGGQGHRWGPQIPADTPKVRQG